MIRTEEDFIREDWEYEGYIAGMAEEYALSHPICPKCGWNMEPRYEPSGEDFFECLNCGYGMIV